MACWICWIRMVSFSAEDIFQAVVRVLLVFTRCRSASTPREGVPTVLAWFKKSFLLNSTRLMKVREGNFVVLKHTYVFFSTHDSFLYRFSSISPNGDHLILITSFMVLTWWRSGEIFLLMERTPQCSQVETCLLLWIWSEMLQQFVGERLQRWNFSHKTAKQSILKCYFLGMMKACNRSPMGFSTFFEAHSLAHIGIYFCLRACYWFHNEPFKKRNHNNPFHWC